MSELSGWDLLEARDLQAALRVLKEEHDARPFKGTLNNLGICCLMLQQPTEAKRLFDEALTMPLPDSGTHGFAGIARWVLNEREDAVTLWCDGLKCNYRDAAGGVSLPLLLYYASVRRPDEFSREHAEQFLRTALESRRASNWPGGLGRYVLGEISEDQARAEADAGHPIVTARHLNQLEFYQGMMALEQHDTELFLAYMRNCADTHECELNKEWHLACHECATFGK